MNIVLSLWVQLDWLFPAGAFVDWLSSSLRLASWRPSLRTSRRSLKLSVDLRRDGSPNSQSCSSRRRTTRSPAAVRAVQTSRTPRAAHCPVGEHQPGVMHRSETARACPTDSSNTARSVSQAMHAVRLIVTSPSGTSIVSTNQGACTDRWKSLQCRRPDVPNADKIDNSSWGSVTNIFEDAVAGLPMAWPLAKVLGSPHRMCRAWVDFGLLGDRCKFRIRRGSGAQSAHGGGLACLDARASRAGAFSEVA